MKSKTAGMQRIQNELRVKPLRSPSTLIFSSCTLLIALPNLAEHFTFFWATDRRTWNIKTIKSRGLSKKYSFFLARQVVKVKRIIYDYIKFIFLTFFTSILFFFFPNTPSYTGVYCWEGNSSLKQGCYQDLSFPLPLQGRVQGVRKFYLDAFPALY